MKDGKENYSKEQTVTELADNVLNQVTGGANVFTSIPEEDCFIPDLKTQEELRARVYEEVLLKKDQIPVTNSKPDKSPTSSTLEKSSLPIAGVFQETIHNQRSF